MQRVAPPDADFAKYPRHGRFCGWVTAFATEGACFATAAQKLGFGHDRPRIAEILV